MILPKKIWGKELSACDLHQAAGALQSSYTDINHWSTAIKILLITIGLTDLYLDLFSVICKTHNIKSIVGLDHTTCFILADSRNMTEWTYEMFRKWVVHSIDFRLFI